MRKINLEQLEAKIYKQLNIEPQLTINNSNYQPNEISDELDELVRESKRKKQRVREELSKAKLDMSQEMANLKWRIQCLKSNHNKLQFQSLTFNQLYTLQRKKYAELRNRRKIKTNDDSYLSMIGNREMRKEKRKIEGLNRIQQHIQTLNQKIQQIKQ